MFKHSIRLFIAALCICVAFVLYAQEGGRTPWWRRLSQPAAPETGYRLEYRPVGVEREVAEVLALPSTKRFTNLQQRTARPFAATVTNPLMRQAMIKYWQQQYPTFGQRLKAGASQFVERLKEGARRGSSSIVQDVLEEQKEVRKTVKLQEDQLADARKHLASIREQSDWLGANPLRWNRTQKEEQEWQASKDVLNKYVTIAKVRELTPAEQIEVVNIRNHMINNLAYEHEKKPVSDFVANKVLAARPTIMQQIKSTVADVKDEKADQIVAKAIHLLKSEKNVDLTDYVINQIVAQLDQQLPYFPQESKRMIAKELIKEAGGAQGTSATRAVLGKLGADAIIQEQGTYNIQWYIDEYLNKYGQKLAKPLVPKIKEGAFRFMAQEIEEQEKRDAALASPLTQQAVKSIIE